MATTFLMDLTVPSSQLESLADTGYITVSGEIVSMTRAHLRLVIESASRVSSVTKDQYVWGFVSYIFGLGSTSAKNLCKALGLNPDATMKQIKW